MRELLTDDSPRTGELLDGRYRLDRRAGEGGMATVYRAQDELLGRTVAIKVFRPGAAEPSESDRTVSETRVLASLNHHALVTLYDARIEDGGLSYLAMEFVDGPTLREHVAAGPMPSAEVASMAFDLAEALHVVHENGVVHRDIKPSNVLLRRSSTPGPAYRAKLADFGIAYLVDSTRVTLPGTIMGTAAYLSPEQVRGAPPAPPADIYALGLLLIEALTGQRAFPQRGTQESLLVRVTQSPEVPGHLGYAWKSLLTAMTAQSPDARPSALDVAVAVRELQLALLVPTTVDHALTAPTVAVAVEPEPTAAVAVEPEPTAAIDMTVAMAVPAAAAVDRAATGPVDAPTRRSRRRTERRRPRLIALAIAIPGAAAAAVLAVLIGVSQGGASVLPESTPIVEPSSPASGEQPASGQQTETSGEPAPVVDTAPSEVTPADDQSVEPETTEPIEPEPVQVAPEPAAPSGNGNGNGNGNGPGENGNGSGNGNGNGKGKGNGK